MKLKLVHYPNPILRKSAEKIKKFDGKLRLIASEMYRLAIKENGIGIAAQQCGLEIRIVICIDPRNNKVYTLCNPEIIAASEEIILFREGCLSFPNIFKSIPRHKEVTVKYQDIRGKQQILKAEGILSVCCQHEIQHLDGVLFIDLI